MDTKFGANIFNRMLLNAAKFQGCSLYRFWVIKENPTGGGGGRKITSPLPRLGLRGSYTAYGDVLESRQVGRTFKLVNPKHEDRASVRCESLSLDLLVC